MGGSTEMSHPAGRRDEDGRRNPEEMHDFALKNIEEMHKTGYNNLEEMHLCRFLRSGGGICILRGKHMISC